MPHRNGAVIAKRAKRSVAAAQRLDGDGPMWPRHVADLSAGASIFDAGFDRRR